MIYLDNAATTYPKPERVSQEMSKVIQEYAGNPNRSTFESTVKVENIVTKTRKKLAKLFNIEDYKTIVFFPNGTYALNQAIKGLLKNGDHVITTNIEHNAVRRPLWNLQKQGIEISYISCSSEGKVDIDEINKSIKKNTKLIIINHASNVIGTIQPIEKIGKIAKENNIVFLVDAAQTAGVYPIDIQKMNIDLLAFPGHKSLFGPTGTGGLYINKNLKLVPLIQGGTGQFSEELEQPELLPERYESGTLNTIGIAGLGAGIDFILDKGIDTIRKHEVNLLKYFQEELYKIKNVIVYGSKNINEKVGVVSFNILGLDCKQVGFILSEVYKIAVRTGLHCAPLAHETIETINDGTVRVSFSYFNTYEDIEKCLDAIKEISDDV